uniref:Uncharacterized protein n=1 Tax=Variovorax paradoxus (strain S110) TaxID=543728 RepID=C5D0M9_VARPS
MTTFTLSAEWRNQPHQQVRHKHRQARVPGLAGPHEELQARFVKRPQHDLPDFARHLRWVHELHLVAVFNRLSHQHGRFGRRARTAENEQIARANTDLARAVSQQIDSTAALAEHIISGLVFELERADITTDSLQRLQHDPVVKTFCDWLLEQGTGVDGAATA